MPTAARQRLVRHRLGAACERGWSKYRTPVIYQDDVMRVCSYNDHALLRFHETLKDAIDLSGIVSPGRYGIWPRHLRKTRG